MRRLRAAVTAVASAVAFTQIASAADLPVKAPRYAPPPVYNWTGLYVGASVGGAWGKADVSLDTVNGARLYTSRVRSSG